jgi:transposase
MLTNVQIEQLKNRPGLGWISALRFEAIRELSQQKLLQLSLFDQRNLAEIESPDYPGERLVACYNPLLAEERRRKRQELLQATQNNLERIAKELARRKRTPLCAAQIGRKVGQIINRHKMAKHFHIEISDGKMQWERKEASIQREEQLDGIYVIRTSQIKDKLDSSNVVRQYKNLGRVEQFFRTCKALDIRIRPIRHRCEKRVRAHIFLCMLAYYVEWHMRQALAPILFEDEEIAKLRWIRDPVAKAEPSEKAKQKKAQRTTPEGLTVHSFENIIEVLGTITRNTCRVSHENINNTFIQISQPSPIQSKALELLGLL